MTLHNHPHEDQALLSRYLDGDLQSDQSTALEEHLKNCPTCRKEVKMLRQTIDWIGQLRRIEAPKDFPQKVRQHVRRQRGKRRRAKAKASTTTNGVSWIPAFLVVIVVTLSLFLFMFGQSIGTKKTNKNSPEEPRIKVQSPKKMTIPPTRHVAPKTSASKKTKTQ